MNLADDELAAVERLATEVAAAGVLEETVWAETFRAVPRHALVPQPMEEVVEGGVTAWRPVDLSDRGAWLDAIYTDRTLVTVVDGDGMPLSSSTKPSLVVGMLAELGLVGGERVLEIGTGTGYSTALLCEGLGRLSGGLVDGQVTTVDVNPELVDTAVRRLDGLGYWPHARAGDGLDGYPPNGPYDRIVATCSVPRIPDAWIDQLAVGGLILADVATGIEGGLVRLEKQVDGSLVGSYARTGARFMPARSVGSAFYPGPPRVDYAPTAATERPTAIGGRTFLHNYPLRLLAGLALPGTSLVYHTGDDGHSVQLQHVDGSWARSPLTGSSGGASVTWGGQRCLWETVEDIADVWRRAGEPDPRSLRWEVRGASQTVTLADRTWEVPQRDPGQV